jgi:hypothetical protein
MATIISHFYNEEYLLPFWLKHHKNMFDYGIMVDYHSTDNSVNIIKEICPEWKIITTRNEKFEAELVDREIEDIESGLSDWHICLNTTEFLIGDMSLLHTTSLNNIIIKEVPMIDSPDNDFTELDTTIDLIKQRYYGVNPFEDNWQFPVDPFLINSRRSRIFKREKITYPPGRHFEGYTMMNDVLPFLVLWYGFSPFNEYTIKRKLQIQENMPESDKQRGFGIQHITDRDKMIHSFKNIYQLRTKNLKSLISPFYDF